MLLVIAMVGAGDVTIRGLAERAYVRQATACQGTLGEAVLVFERLPSRFEFRASRVPPLLEPMLIG